MSRTSLQPGLGSGVGMNGVGVTTPGATVVGLLHSNLLQHWPEIDLRWQSAGSFVYCGHLKMSIILNVLLRYTD